MRGYIRLSERSLGQIDFGYPSAFAPWVFSFWAGNGWVCFLRDVLSLLWLLGIE
nr:MAG TPA: hypothetical protein [Caudoviricetes sp.]